MVGKKSESKQNDLDDKVKFHINKVEQMQEDILAVREVIIQNLSYVNRTLRQRISTLEMRVIQIEKNAK